MNYTIKNETLSPEIIAKLPFKTKEVYNYTVIHTNGLHEVYTDTLDGAIKEIETVSKKYHVAKTIKIKTVKA